MNKHPMMRRSFLKGMVAAAGISTVSFAELFRYSDVFALANGDDLATILKLGATSEALACTHYYTALTDSTIALVPAEVASLKAALDAELQHLQLLNTLGGQALATEFYFPQNIYIDRDQFSEITEQVESAFVGAYLAAVRRTAELGKPDLAATAAQLAATEQVHLALVRQLSGRMPNYTSLGQALFFNTSDSAPIFKGFLEGGQGFNGPYKLPTAANIHDVVGTSGVEVVKPFTDPTLFAGQS